MSVKLVIPGTRRPSRTKSIALAIFSGVRTAQRVALTMLSSLVMIRLGRVYEGLMVDVQPSNEKLVRRSEAILAQLTGHSRDQVRDALRQAKGSVKLALLLLEGRSLDEARGALDTASGDLRAAKTLIEERRTQKKRA